MKITQSLRQTAAEFFANSGMGFKDDQQRKAFFARVSARRRMLEHNAATEDPPTPAPVTAPTTTPAPVESASPAPTPLPAEPVTPAPPAVSTSTPAVLPPAQSGSAPNVPANPTTPSAFASKFGQQVGQIDSLLQNFRQKFPNDESLARWKKYLDPFRQDPDKLLSDPKTLDAMAAEVAGAIGSWTNDPGTRISDRGYYETHTLGALLDILHSAGRLQEWKGNSRRDGYGVVFSGSTMLGGLLPGRLPYPGFNYPLGGMSQVISTAPGGRTQISWQGPLGWSNASRLNTIAPGGLLWDGGGGTLQMINGVLYRDGVAVTDATPGTMSGPYVLRRALQGPLANAGPRGMLQDDKQRRAFFARMHGGGGGRGGGAPSGTRQATPIDGGGMIAAPRQQLPGAPTPATPTMPEHLRYAPGSQNGTVHPDHNTPEYQAWLAERAAWERANYPITGGPVPIGGPISSLPPSSPKPSQPAPPQRPVGGTPMWYKPPVKPGLAPGKPTDLVPLGHDGLVAPRAPERPASYPNYQTAIQQELAKRQSAQQEQVLAGLKKFTPAWLKKHTR